MMDGSLTFLGNATVLLRYGDLTLLTDPNFLHRGEWAYLGHGLVSKRLRDPAMSVAQLPPVHVIALSHMHGDHWDRRAHKELDHSIPVVTTEHAAAKLRRRGFEWAKGLQTWDSHTVHRFGSWVRITSMPGRHGPRWASTAKLVPPVMGSMVEFGHEGSPADIRIYISGDTLLFADLAEIPRRYPIIDSAVLHLGGTRLPFGRRLPWGITVTMDGVQGSDAAQLFSPASVVPVHYDDYGVFASPLSQFLDEMADRQLGESVVHVGRGESVSFTSLQG